MAVIPLISAQMVPPKIKRYLPRERLDELGSAILAHRVTTVIAPAGYGKSVWISSLLTTEGWPSSAWLTLERYNSEPSILVYHLVHAFRKIWPDFGQATLRTLNSLEYIRRDWQIALAALIDEYPQNMASVLVLDDLYLIDSNDIARLMLEYLIRWLPDCARLVLVSRHDLPLNLHHALLRGDLLEIGSHELLFSIDETWQFFNLLDIRLDKEALELIQLRTEGWAVGLRIIALRLSQAGPDINLRLPQILTHDARLYSYLNSELLDNLPAEFRSFLLDAALLPYLESGMCNAVLARTDCEGIIRQLHYLGLLSLSEGRTLTWRLHHLIREFLVQAAAVRNPANHIQTIRSRAAGYFESAGLIDRALDQLAALADWTAAASLIIRSGDYYFLQHGRVDALNSWISRLPAEVVQNDQWLLFLQGMCLLHLKHEEATKILSDAADIARGKNDVRCQLRALIALVSIYAFANNVSRLQETTDRIPEAALLAQNPWTLGVSLVAGMGRAVWTDDLRQGIVLGKMVQVSQLDAESHMQYAFATSMLSYRQGNLEFARQTIDDILEDPYVRENERWTGTALVIKAYILMLSGEHGQLALLLDRLLDLGQKYHIPHQIGLAFRRQAQLCQWSGQYADARTHYEKSRAAFQHYNNRFMTLLSDLDLLLLRQKSGEDARKVFQEANELWPSLAAISGGQGLDDYAQSVMGILAMEAGQLELARHYFLTISASCIRKGARQVLAGTRMLLAQVSQLQRLDDEADDYLRQALGEAETAHWIFFWDWHADVVFSLCRRALIRKIHMDWAAFMLIRWFPQQTCETLGHLLACPDQHVRMRIAGFFAETARKSRMPLIHVHCLGGFRIYVNGCERTETQWKTKKAENLAKILLTSRRPLQKDKLIDEFWPEADPHLGDASLRQALTHVRHTIGLADYRDEPVILRQQMVYINPEIEVYSDYERFISLAQKAIAAQKGNQALATGFLEEAIDLYKGDYLPDNLYDDWTGSRRAELRNLFLEILLLLIDAYGQEKRPLLAVQSCLRFLDLEPTHEKVCRTAMELLCQEGLKVQALDLYRKLARRLAGDFGIAPSEQTTALYDKIHSS